MPFTLDTGFYFVAGLVLTVALLGALGWLAWRGKLDRGGAHKGRCGFHPARLSLTGHQGEVLMAVIAAEGPPGSVFATFVEEPWVVVAPSSGMFPQQLEISVYTKHAPDGRRHNVTVRLLPIDGESQFGSLDLTLKIRKARGAQIGTRL